MNMIVASFPAGCQNRQIIYLNRQESAPGARNKMLDGIAQRKVAIQKADLDAGLAVVRALVADPTLADPAKAQAALTTLEAMKLATTPPPPPRPAPRPSAPAAPQRPTAPARPVVAPRPMPLPQPPAATATAGPATAASPDPATDKVSLPAPVLTLSELKVCDNETLIRHFGSGRITDDRSGAIVEHAHELIFPIILERFTARRLTGREINRMIDHADPEIALGAHKANIGLLADLRRQDKAKISRLESELLAAQAAPGGDVFAQLAALQAQFEVLNGQIEQANVLLTNLTSRPSYRDRQALEQQLAQDRNELTSLKTQILSAQRDFDQAVLPLRQQISALSDPATKIDLSAEETAALALLESLQGNPAVRAEAERQISEFKAAVVSDRTRKLEGRIAALELSLQNKIKVIKGEPDRAAELENKRIPELERLLAEIGPTLAELTDRADALNREIARLSGERVTIERSVVDIQQRILAASAFVRPGPKTA